MARLRFNALIVSRDAPFVAMLLMIHALLAIWVQDMMIITKHNLTHVSSTPVETQTNFTTFRQEIVRNALLHVQLVFLALKIV
jgi:hypothetical protein